MKKINNKSIILSLRILSILAFGLLMVPSPAAADYGINTTFGNFDNGYNAPTPSYQPPVNNPKPIINSINPSSSVRNTGTRTITITGSGFIPSSVARVNGANRYTTFIDSAHLMIQLNSGDMYRTDGGFYITVWNNAPGGGYSNSAYFTVSYTPGEYTTTTNTNNYNSYPNTVNDNNYNNYNQTDNTVNTNTTRPDGSDLASSVILGSNTSFFPSGLVQWVIFAIIILLLVILVRKIFGAKDRYHASPLKHD